MNIVQFVLLAGCVHVDDMRLFPISGEKHFLVEASAKAALLTRLNGSSGCLDINEYGSDIYDLCKNDDERQALRDWMLGDTYDVQIMKHLLTKYFMLKKDRVKEMVKDWIAETLEGKCEFLLSLLLEEQENETPRTSQGYLHEMFDAVWDKAPDNDDASVEPGLSSWVQLGVVERGTTDAGKRKLLLVGTPVGTVVIDKSTDGNLLVTAPKNKMLETLIDVGVITDVSQLVRIVGGTISERCVSNVGIVIVGLVEHYSRHF